MDTNFSIGLVVTGSEVYHKRIKDKFGPAVRSKFDKLGSCVKEIIFVYDLGIYSFRYFSGFSSKALI